MNMALYEALGGGLGGAAGAKLLGGAGHMLGQGIDLIDIPSAYLRSGLGNMIGAKATDQNSFIGDVHSGRDLLQGMGVVGEDDQQFGLDDIGGMGVDMALDPIGMATGMFGAKLGAKAGKAAGRRLGTEMAIRKAGPAIDALDQAKPAMSLTDIGMPLSGPPQEITPHIGLPDFVLKSGQEAMAPPTSANQFFMPSPGNATLSAANPNVRIPLSPYASPPGMPTLDLAAERANQLRRSFANNPEILAKIDQMEEARRAAINPKSKTLIPESPTSLQSGIDLPQSPPTDSMPGSMADMGSYSGSWDSGLDAADLPSIERGILTQDMLRSRHGDTMIDMGRDDLVLGPPRGTPKADPFAPGGDQTLADMLKGGDTGEFTDQISLTPGWKAMGSTEQEAERLAQADYLRNISGLGTLDMIPPADQTLVLPGSPAVKRAMMARQLGIGDETLAQLPPEIVQALLARFTQGT